jgi:hypothetical protein
MATSMCAPSANQRRPKGEWAVHHQLGHVEKRKKYKWKDPLAMTEWGTTGSARERWRKRNKRRSGWCRLLIKWNVEMERGERIGSVACS